MKFWLWHLLSLDFSKIAVMKCFDLLMWSAIVVCRIMLKFSNKNTFFLHEMDKLTVVLMSLKWLNKIERPLTFFPWNCRWAHRKLWLPFLIINYATRCDLTKNLREIILRNHRKRMLTFFLWNCRWAHRKLWPPLKVNGNSCQEIVKLWDKFSPLETTKLSCLVTSNGWFGTLKKHFTLILGKFNPFKTFRKKFQC